jgi:hypothetical protein
MTTNERKSFQTYRTDKAETDDFAGLAFLIHFIGDVHQPRHVATVLRDTGANGFQKLPDEESCYGA